MNVFEVQKRAQRPSHCHAIRLRSPRMPKAKRLKLRQLASCNNPALRYAPLVAVAQFYTLAHVCFRAVTCDCAELDRCPCLDVADGQTRGRIGGNLREKNFGVSPGHIYIDRLREAVGDLDRDGALRRWVLNDDGASAAAKRTNESREQDCSHDRYPQLGVKEVI